MLAVLHIGLIHLRLPLAVKNPAGDDGSGTPVFVCVVQKGRDIACPIRPLINAKGLVIDVEVGAAQQ